jgi:hypothetical protein
MPEGEQRIDRDQIKKVRRITGVLEKVEVIDSFFRGKPGKQFQFSFGEVETDVVPFPRFRIWFSTNNQGEIRPNTKAGHAFRNVQMLLPGAKDFYILQGRKQTWEMGEVAIQYQDWLKKYPCWLLTDVEKSPSED